MSFQTNDDIFKFLEHYENEPVIWNPKDVMHKDKKKVHDAWVRISNEMQISIPELKKKKEALMARFRQHLKKKKASISSGCSEEDVYKPIWVFYDIMETFLEDVYECSSKKNTLTQAIEEEFNSTDQHIDATQEQSSSSSNVTVQEGPPPPPKRTVLKRRSSNPPELQRASEQMENALNTLNTALANKSTQKEDMCDLYGKLLASKLRKYFSDYEQQEVMFELDKLLADRIRNRDARSSCSSTSQVKMGRPSTSQSFYSDPPESVPPRPFSSHGYPIIHIPEQTNLFGNMTTMSSPQYQQIQQPPLNLSENQIHVLSDEAIDSAQLNPILREAFIKAVDCEDMWSPVEYTGGAGVAGGGGSRPAPCARAKHSATLLGGHVYVLGGRGASGAVPLRDFWRYTLASGVWERLQCRGEPPPSLQEHTATAHHSKLYIFGGEATALSSETPLWIYDTETQYWRKLPGHTFTGTVRRRGRGGSAQTAGAGAGPSGRRGHSAHALKDCLLIYGGYKDLRGSTNELWAFHYECESWQQVRTASPGPARHRHAAALHDARLYVYGGQCDLRACADLWLYDTISRVWSAVRPLGKLSPGARGGAAAARAGGHLYLFGGDCAGHAASDMWRFHFATETWERILPSTKWPAARVDACALLVPRAPLHTRPPTLPLPSAATTDCAPRAPPTLLSRLSSFHVRRTPRCAYSVLGERDSTESLPRDSPAINKSRSAHHLARRQPADGADNDTSADNSADTMTREPISVPDFADMVLPTPVLSPAQAAKLVYLDSDEENEMRRERERDRDGTTIIMPKSASVRFTKDPITTDEEEGEFSTSDYASAERVNRLSGASLGFSNPHYLGPDIRTLGVALTPDSGLGPGDIELQDMASKRARSVPREREERLHLLLVGGREPPHVARLQGPLSMWTYRLL